MAFLFYILCMDGGFYVFCGVPDTLELLAVWPVCGGGGLFKTIYNDSDWVLMSNLENNVINLFVEV